MLAEVDALQLPAAAPRERANQRRLPDARGALQQHRALELARADDPPQIRRRRRRVVAEGVSVKIAPCFERERRRAVDMSVSGQRRPRAVPFERILDVAHAATNLREPALADVSTRL